ncbi:hypothetical protein EalM132_00082 [Exiguobacterium phage vB_EalM-132]|nr:hypothetical protein EalM132_00082 [Exiguobacterium phage vB_EalM-132]
MSTESYITENAHPITVERIFTSLSNLSYYLMDKDTKLVLPIARYATRRCQIGQDDKLSMNIPQLTDINVGRLGQLEFINIPSRELIKAHKGIERGDTEYVYNTYLSVDEYPSLLRAIGVDYNARVFLAYVYLESYCLLRACVDYIPDRLFKYSETELSTLSDNIYFIRTYIGTLGNSIESYEMLDVLKQLHRDIFYIREYIKSMSR